MSSDWGEKLSTGRVVSLKDWVSPPFCCQYLGCGRVSYEKEERRKKHMKYNGKIIRLYSFRVVLDIEIISFHALMLFRREWIPV